MNTAEAHAVLSRSLDAAGLTGQGSLFRLQGSDIQWVVHIDHLPFGNRFGIDIGLDLQIDSAPTLPTDCGIVLHVENLEPFRSCAIVEALNLDSRLDDRAAIVAALDLDTYLDDAQRQGVLERAVQALGAWMMERSTLAAVRRAYRAGELDSGFIHKDVRDLLEDKTPAENPRREAHPGRHLTINQSIAALGRGRCIEQLLGRDQLDDGRWTVRWVTICRATQGYRVVIHHVEDVGTPDFLDVSEFPPIDSEEHSGEGQIVGEADSPMEAIQLAGAVGADSGRWVNQGLIDDEYGDEAARLT